MDTRRTLFARLQTHVARWLVKGPASPLILAGTLAMAGPAALALNGAPDMHSWPTPSYFSGNCFADPDGDGTTVCYINRSQLSSYPDGHCRPDPDGDGHFVCHIEGQ